MWRNESPEACPQRNAWTALVIGALEWLRALVMLAAARMSAGIPASRMILILGTVVILTLLAALSFHHWRLRAFYRLSRSGEKAAPTQ